MTDVAIRFTGVSKRFRRGEQHDSLRDLVPAIARRVLGKGPSRDASKRDFWALTDIDLTIRKGETLGVIGSNGAGKSTMLKHLAGIMTPTRGRIEVNGRLSALIEVGAGFHPDLTGRENVYLCGVILGMSRAEVARKFDAIVEFSGIAPFIDTPVKRYSSGMFARLGFSVAAHLEPDILVIDEVLSVGDFIFQQKSLQKMRDIASGGSTVIFVSHNLKSVADLCRRSVLLEQGRIAADASTDEVIQTYLGRERRKMERNRDVDVEITAVTLTRGGDPTVQFRSGEPARVRVSFTARRARKSVAVVVGVLDDGLEQIFYTSNTALGQAPVDLQPGDSAVVEMELELHLVGGTFHIAVWLRPADLDVAIDGVVPAVTFVVSADSAVRGTVNMRPRAVSVEVNSVASRQVAVE